MRASRWSGDTIARWFAANIVIAVIACIGLNALFLRFAGVWARPSLVETGLLDQAAAITRVMATTPRASRPMIAAAASNKLYRVAWYSNRAELPPNADCGVELYDGLEKLRELLERPDVRAIGCDQDRAMEKGAAMQGYTLSISLPDDSWVQFSTAFRSWGIDARLRYVLTVTFVVMSSILVAALASRRLARPMERFARAAQRFGADVNAPPMQVKGPVEFQSAMNAFNDMQARIQRFITDRTAMLAAISHDLRAPLTRLRLRGEFVEDVEQQKKLFRDVDEMQAMVNSALSFFRDDGTQEAITRFNLSEMVNTVLDDFRDAGENVSYHGPLNEVYVGRPLSLRRAITNVIDNAIKYGGSASVSMHATQSDVVIVVDDEGDGIPSELHEAVFRPFFRSEPSRNRKTGGIGLGLSAARSTVRGHGGDILLVNRQPRGLSVHVMLPRTEMPLPSPNA